MIPIEGHLRHRARRSDTKRNIPPLLKRITTKSSPMQYYVTPCQCVNCLEKINPNVQRESINLLGYALCNECQPGLKNKLRNTTRETIKLYFSLKRRGIRVSFNGMHSIQVSCRQFDMNIEVSDPQENYHPERALAALHQVLNSISKNHRQLKVTIPNALVAYNLNETTDCFTTILKQGVQEDSYANAHAMNRSSSVNSLLLRNLLAYSASKYRRV